MNYETARQLSPQAFRRHFGVKPETFKHLLKVLEEAQPKHPRPGKKASLTCAEQLMVTLQYWREYRTYFHIAGDWNISEATVCRVVRRVETLLMRSGKFRLPGKKVLKHKGFGTPEVVLLDVSETPIERPKRQQRRFYSGKRKHHTLKLQVIADQATGQIICLAWGPGRSHDFALFKASGVSFDLAIETIADSGYQGIAEQHPNSYIPRKKPKGGELSSLEKSYNRALGQERIGIEHINGRLKVFKILSTRYRNRRRRYGLRCNLLAAIYNYELEAAA